MTTRKFLKHNGSAVADAMGGDIVEAVVDVVMWEKKSLSAVPKHRRKLIKDATKKVRKSLTKKK